MKDLPISRPEAVGLFYYQIVDELMSAPPGKLTEKVRELAQRQFHDAVNKRIVTFSERTLFRLYKKYREAGFEGLMPKPRSDKGTHPSLDPQVIRDILELKKELPARSAAKIITMLTLAGKIEEDSLTPRTVNRILNQYGYTRQVLSRASRAYIKHEKEHINQMWQGDVMSACYIPCGPGGETKLAYLVGFIDDCSRRCVHAEFYFDATLPRVEDVLKKALTKFGVPLSAYLDNGKVYVSEQFKLLCARLGIRLRYSTPFQPSGKGKIEKFWQFVQNSFLPEVKKHKVASLGELNDLFFAWLKTEYNDRPHASLEDNGKLLSPAQRWQKDIRSGIQLRYLSPLQLDEVFLHEVKRTVDKYGVIPFEGNTYEAPAELVLKEVTVRYNPFHLDNLHIYHNGIYFGTARVIDLRKERHRNVANVPEEYVADTEISRLYLENIKSQYQRFLKEQLKKTQDTAATPQSSVDISHADTGGGHPVKPSTVPVVSISRDTFMEMVARAIGVEELTFAEKGKLHELWGTFREFNRDILEHILSDLSEKTADFNRNFVYYIAAIRNQYLKQLAKLKEEKNS